MESYTDINRPKRYYLEANGDIPQIQSKGPKAIIEEMIEHSRIYKDNDINLIIKSSSFEPTTEWCEEFRELYTENNLHIKWKCSSNVEELTPHIISTLSTAGLKVLDINIKSASYSQLTKIEAVKNPYEYLSRLEELLVTALQCGVWITLNILLYPNEEKVVIEETKQWLANHKELVKYVSVKPVAMEVNNQEIGELAANILTSMDISKSATTDGDYFDLKKFVHFQKSYSYKDFINDIIDLDPNTLPFITPWEDKVINPEKIVIFGGMGTGKSLLTELIEEELKNNNVEVHSHNIGDTCRFFMKIGDINPYWSNNTRSLSQQIASKLREVDKDLLNEVVLADIHKIEEQNDKSKKTAHIVTGGRTLEDFKYWNNKNYLTIGIVANREETSERLKTRDEGQVQDEKNLAHETEKNTDFISTKLCRVLVENNGTIEELRDKARDIVKRYIIQ